MYTRDSIYVFIENDLVNTNEGFNEYTVQIYNDFYLLN